MANAARDILTRVVNRSIAAGQEPIVEQLSARTLAYRKLPQGAVWSCSFGDPGDGGFTEFYRVPNGWRYKISNGPWNGPLNWTCTKVGD